MSPRRTGSIRRRRRERGAAVAEFAIVVPVLLTLVLGMVSAGLAYSRNLTLSHASMQAGRFGATLSQDDYASTNAWLDAIVDYAVARGGNDFDADTPGRFACASFVAETGVVTTRRLIGASSRSSTNSLCDPGHAIGGATFAYIQVQLERSDEIEIIFQSFDVTLSQTVTFRYEVESP